MEWRFFAQVREGAHASAQQMTLLGTASGRCVHDSLKHEVVPAGSERRPRPF
jgi:hypothetical protein